MDYYEKAFLNLVEDYQNRLVAYKDELLQISESAHTLSCKDIAQIKDIAHRLKGSGKAYGFPEISYEAGNVETACEVLEQEPSHLSQKQFSNTLLYKPFNQLIDVITHAAGAEVPESGAGALKPQHAQEAVKKNQIKLLIIDDDNEFSAMLSKDLAQFGYQTHLLADISQLAEAIEHYCPDAILVDMEFYGERLAGAEQVSYWQERSGYPLPVIFISAHDSFDVRLAAVKAGGHHFLNKPVNLQRLTALLRKELGVTEEESPFRILLVDDDQDLLKLYESILRQEGYAAFTASSAEQALEMLTEVSPELLLIDVFMPKCNGIELGHLIRQHEGYFDTALLFMSGATDTDIQLACARLASDEFISKPIEPWRLRMVVKSRVAQIRRRKEIQVTHDGELKELFDELTGLPMRSALQERIGTLLRKKKREVALLKLDVRNFHTINNIYGPFRGDELLQAIAWCLTQAIAANGSVYRTGGDEFYALIEPCNQAVDIERVVKAIVGCFAQKYDLNDEQGIAISADIGIAVRSPLTNDADAFMAHAETALFQAKSNPAPSVVYFDEVMQVWEEDRFKLFQALEQAFLRNEFTTLYQPIFSVHERKVVGFEALARWQHPARGLIGPAHFISVLEDTDLIIKLTNLMLEHALTQLAHWHTSSPDLFMSINLSARDIQSPVFLDVLSDLIKRLDINPRTVALEITETSLLSDWQQASKICKTIKSMGIKIALDDFGTGYSSLNYLSRIDAETLKIDRGFIDDWSTTGDGNLLRAMVQLGHTMGMQVVAEGVEQQKELAFLQALNCDYYQGFLSAKPMLAEDIETNFLSH